jgi:hypothetical protein
VPVLEKRLRPGPSARKIFNTEPLQACAEAMVGDNLGDERAQASSPVVGFNRHSQWDGSQQLGEVLLRGRIEARDKRDASVDSIKPEQVRGLQGFMDDRTNGNQRDIASLP